MKPHLLILSASICLAPFVQGSVRSKNTSNEKKTTVLQQENNNKGERPQASSVQNSYILKDPKNYSLAPSRQTPEIQKWIRIFTKTERERFKKFFNRGSRYKKVIQGMLLEQGLPTDLYYLAILESGFHKKAVSHAGAVGTWQFMASTAQQYGLIINSYVDERLDPVRSTYAASRYLKALFRQYKDWKLALSAYNAGPRRVRRAMSRGGKDFWQLSRRKLLPKETRNYVPQFLALVHIGRNIEKYGIEESRTSYHHSADLVSVPGPLKLKDVSTALGMSSLQLKKMNAHLLQGMTPPGKKIYDLWVPKKYASKLLQQKNQLSQKVLKEFLKL